MTPEQRMKFMTLVSSWEDALTPKAGMATMQELIEFVEHLEFRAHSAGQDHMGQALRDFSVCPYRDDSWAHPEWNPE